VAALRAAQLGATVTLVEEREVGGVCLNRGCIPSKAIIESARVLGMVKHAEQFGVKIGGGGAEIDYPAVMKRKDGVVTRLRNGLSYLLRNSKITVTAGRARMLDPHTVEVAGKEGTSSRIEGRKVIVATGSEPARPKIFSFDNPRVMTSDEALTLTRLPASALVIGGGYIGCEFASMWAEFGSAVTLVEMLPGLLPMDDADVSKEMERSLARQRVKVLTGTKVEKMTATDLGVVSELTGGETLETDVALVAVGRKPTSDVEGLAALGVKLNERGAITVDALGRTDAQDVSAIGDVTGKIMLAHYASEQGVIAAEDLFGGEAHPEALEATPSCVFTTPEIASVGLTEAEARKRHGEIRVGRFPFAALGKAVASGETAGFVKVVGDAGGTVLGVHMVGGHVTNMIGEATLAVRLKLTMDEIVHTIHAHPTMGEALHEAALDFFGRALHKA
jgi:dihydrolipoamide dehydrogenase